MGVGFKIPRNQAKALFFDRPEVLSEMDRETLKVFRRFGGFVRKVARRSIKKRKRKTSAPGSPPHSRGAHLLRNNIFFHYDPNQRSVVIGPTALNQTSGDNDGDVPRLLEEGGTATRHFWLRITKQQARDEFGRFGPGQGTFVDPNKAQGQLAPVEYVHSDNAPAVRVNYEPRPYMRPAFGKGQDKLDDFWR
jgi:hypothetical protein